MSNDKLQEAVSLLRTIREDADRVMEHVDLHAAETNGTDECSCEIPLIAGAVADAHVRHIDTFLASLDSQQAGAAQEKA